MPEPDFAPPQRSLSPSGADHPAQDRSAPPRTLTGRATALLADDWPAVLAMVVATTLYLIKGFGGLLGRDPGVYAYGAEQVARGVLPYVGMMNRSGPLGQAVPGAGIWVFNLLGVDPLIGARITMMLVSVASVGAAYWAAKSLWASRLAGAVAAFGLISFQAFSYYATWGPREKTLMVLFVILVLIAMSRGAWILAGAAVALATLTWQPQFFFTMAGVVVAILLGVPGLVGKLKAVIRVAVGGLVATAVVFLPYVLTGNVKAFIDCFVVIPSQYTQQKSFLQHPLQVFASVHQAFGNSLWIILAGLVAHAAASIWALAGDRRTDQRQAAVIGAGTLAAAALVWSVLDFGLWPDMFVFLPSASVGLGWLVSAWGERRARQAGVVALALTLGMTAVATVYAFDSAGSKGLARQRAIASAVYDPLPPDVTTLSLNAPQWMSVANRVNLTSIQIYDTSFLQYLQGSYTGGYVAYQQKVLAAPPDVIIDGQPHFSSTGWLKELKTHYELMGISGPYHWYVSLSIDPAVRETIKRNLSKIHSVTEPPTNNG